MRSKLEENIAEELDKLGIKYTYERDKLKYVIEAQYIPDFKVGDVYLEAKGYFPPDQRRNFVNQLINIDISCVPVLYLLFQKTIRSSMLKKKSTLNFGQIR